MKQYKIKYTAIFKGEILVNADNKEQAKDIVKAGFSEPIIEIGTHHSWMAEDKTEQGILNYDFDIHPEETKIN